jgi:hypothetical protein
LCSGQRMYVWWSIRSDGHISKPACIVNVFDVICMNVIRRGFLHSERWCMHTEHHGRAVGTAFLLWVQRQFSIGPSVILRVSTKNCLITTYFHPLSNSFFTDNLTIIHYIFLDIVTPLLEPTRKYSQKRHAVDWFVIATLTFPWIFLTTCVTNSVGDILTTMNWTTEEPWFSYRQR